MRKGQDWQAKELPLVIENIITTHDDLYKSGLNIEKVKSFSAKEVQNCIPALIAGFELVSENGLLTTIYFSS